MKQSICKAEAISPRQISATSSGVDCKELFTLLVNGSIDKNNLALRHVKYVLQTNIDTSYAHDDLCSDLLSFNEDRLRQREPRPAQNDKPHASVATLRCAQYVLANYAPTGLLYGFWLSGVSTAATSLLPYVCTLSKVFHDFVRVDQPGSCIAQVTRSLLDKNFINVPATCSANFPERLGCLPFAFKIANFYQAISFYPRTYLAEILGITLYEVAAGIPEIVHSTFEFFGAFPDNLDGRSRGQQASHYLDLVDALSEYLHNHGAAERNAILAKVVHGYEVARSQRLQWQERVETGLSNGYLSPPYQMKKLLQARARQAAGYHRNIRMGGDVLENLLQGGTEELMEALSRSRYIDTTQPRQSRLIRSATDINGRMFGIFTVDELNKIEEWIKALREPCERSPIHDKALDEFLSQESMSMLVSAEVIERNNRSKVTLDSIDVRDAYRCLLNYEFNPSIQDYAARYVERWFGAWRNLIRKGKRPIPFTEYGHERLRKWFQMLVVKQASEYQENQEISITRDELIDESTQLAPMILIDGGWLQFVKRDCELIFTKYGWPLYNTYYDEIGRGKLAWNHPRIYRDLLKEMNVALPACGSADFSRWASFDDAAFAVPVFWLSLSFNTKKYLPELLGLNLAMELAGVGGAYRKGRDQLAKYKFSTLFVDLHNTIDNCATGHSAMAVDAIMHYMDQHRECDGASASADVAWERVWVGYCSLSPPEIPQRSFTKAILEMIFVSNKQ